MKSRVNKAKIFILCLYSASPPKYIKLEGGYTCSRCSKEGLVVITSKAKCELASVKIGLGALTATEINMSDRPGGCYLWNGQLRFNKAFNGAGYRDTAPICKLEIEG